MASIAKAVISNNTNRVTQTTADVIVLGAGIAGLQAANDIVLKNLLNNTTKQQQPTNNNHNNNNNNNNVKKIVVLEARNRIGGRIYTTKGYGPKNNVIEHGAQFVHGATNENPVVQLAIESKAIKKLKNLRKLLIICSNSQRFPNFSAIFCNYFFQIVFDDIVDLL